MGQLKWTFFFFCLAACYLQAKGADKYTDENRPYEFGFSIDGEQHRHEKKDENGIIMGEFGFITADGVYHVTVYATDEQGRFKILSMKNIRVKPYPGTSTAISTAKATGVKKGHSLPFPPSENIVSTTEGQKPEKDDIFSPAKSCSHCSIPTTTSRPIQPANTEYSMYTSIKTNNQRKENTANSQPSSVPQGINYQGTVKSQMNQSQKSTQADAGLSSLQNFNSQNIGPKYQEPQNYQQNAQGFGQINSNQESPNLAGIQQGLGNNDNKNNNNPRTPLFDSNFQTPNSGTNNGQQLESDPNSFQGSTFENKSLEIDDALTNKQRMPALQSNYDDKNIDQYNGNTRILSDNTNRQQSDSDQNSYLRSSNEPAGINEPPAFSNYNRENNDFDHNDDNKEIQSQHANTESSNLQSIHNQGPQNLPGISSGGRDPKQFGSFGQNQNANTESSNLKTFNNQGSQNLPGITSAERNPKQFGSFGQTQIQKPMLIAAQMQIVDKNTDIHYKKPGEQDGLPNGLTEGDMEHLLYTFNYTVGFHGHFEEGYTSGAKQGYYFVTGRNGVRTRIDYTADETGFHPKISQEVLDLLSDEVPKPETEKDEKYGLKGYEFKWLYYPVGSK